MTATLTPTDSPMTVLPRVEFVTLLIAVRWRRPTVIPGAVIANVLRGALGITFRRLICPAEWMKHDCHPCPLYAECAYGQVFMPTPPADASQLRLQQDLPRPFVIEPPGLNPDAPVTPDLLTFRLTLLGTAIDRLPYFITTLERLGHEGMGRDRVPFTVDTITAHHPQGDEPLFTHGSTTVRLPRQRITTSDVIGPPEAGGSHPPGLPSQTFTLHFLTPTLLKSGSGLDDRGRRIAATEVRDRPPFGVIARRLRDRLSALCTFFGEPWQHPDFAHLGRQADAVTLTDSQTLWLTRRRTSTRTGDTHEVSGFIGQATYEFPNPETLATFLPLLKLAEHLHLGKHAPWGNGKVNLTAMPQNGAY